MDKITKEYIEQHAPDLSTIKNAQGLSKKGLFLNHSRNQEDDLYFAECSGSGKSTYKVSADFLKENQPIFRCSCPSRKLPCKHSIGLLEEILKGKTFNISDIPQDILNKREKQEKRKENAEKRASEPAKPKKINKTARLKKINKQLEGLEIAQTMVDELLSKGLSLVESTPIKYYKDIAKTFGNYYLTGVQDCVLDLITAIKNIEAKEKNYQEVLLILVKINTLVKKSRDFLNQSLQDENAERQDNELYEALGGVWKLEELNELGLKKENASLLELSFVSKDELEQAYYIDIESGQINPFYNYRPAKSAKYIKEADCNFSVVNPKILTYYPGEQNQRIRWGEFSIRDIKKSDIESIRKYAQNIEVCLKNAKNYLKNPLSRKSLPAIIGYKQIGINENGDCILVDNQDNQIQLAGNLRNELPTKELYENQVLFGEIFYEHLSKSIKILPLSIIDETKVIRL